MGKIIKKILIIIGISLLTIPILIIIIMLISNVYYDLKYPDKNAGQVLNELKTYIYDLYYLDATFFVEKYEISINSDYLIFKNMYFDLKSEKKIKDLKLELIKMIREQTSYENDIEYKFKSREDGSLFGNVVVISYSASLNIKSESRKLYLEILHYNNDTAFFWIINKE